jgi:hypothetical protein
MTEFERYHSDEANRREALRLACDVLERALTAEGKISAMMTAALAEFNACQEATIGLAKRGGNEFTRHLYARGVADKIMRAAQ